ncbi:MAG: enoyl-CoA hydratase [Actinobacteria bacterium]|nr:enoyl-CoA hydratase [Actinomycetota bacterium]
MTAHVQWEQPAEHVGLAVIDRQERRNALTAELCDELRSRLESARGLRALVITGEGKAFCAGADLARRSADTEPGAGGLEHGGGDTFRPSFERLLDAIVNHPAPVIAAVNGPALGAGMQLAVACDLRVASESATFGIPAARLGVVLSAANVRRLALLIGHAAARDLLMTGRALTIDDADRLGIVHRRGRDARVVGLSLAEELAGLAPLTVQGHKRALNLVMAQGALGDAALAEVGALEAAAFASDDLQEGLAAFAEKRPPVFGGN